MATDLERFVKERGRAALVKDVRRRIDAEGISTSTTSSPPSPAESWARASRRSTGRRSRRRASSSSTGRRPTSSPTDTATTSATGPRRRSSSASRSRTRSSAPVGSEGRPRLVHLLPQPRGARGSGRVPQLGLPRQPQTHAGGVREGHRAPSPRRHRARDDVAQAQRGRHARRQRQDEALLLPHRPVLRAPADHPQGRRVRPGDGARHDPGRPRGRAGPDRAELRLRPGGEHRRQPVHLPPGLQGGRPRARCLPLLHAEAVHGRLGKRVPPQHLALEGRRERVHARRATTRRSRARPACTRSVASSSTSPR